MFFFTFPKKTEDCWDQELPKVSTDAQYLTDLDIYMWFEVSNLSEVCNKQKANINVNILALLDLI